MDHYSSFHFGPASLRLVLAVPFCMAFSGESVSGAVADGLAATDLRLEYRINPVGIDERAPRFSWIVQTDRRATRQVSYRVQVAASERALLDEKLLWDSGEVASDRSTQIAYGGPPLESGQRYFWRVRIVDNHGRASAWSGIAYWEMGLLDEADWKAQWIEPEIDEDTSTSPPAPMVRREFTLDGPVRSARLYVTAHGVYEAEINGTRVGNEVFSPGWTSYHNRLQVQTHDITELVRPGANAIGVFLGDGWFRGYIGFGGQRNFYGDRLALLAQLVITYEDGRSEIVGTDDRWKAATGPILSSDIYNGEHYDARLERTGWSAPGFDDSDWKGVRIADHGKRKLVGQNAPPVRRIQELRPREILVTPEGRTVVDFGQNMIGWVRLRVEGNKGDKVTLRHAEVLDRHGNFYTDNLRAADQINTYTLRGNGVETWEPRFTFQGFRYVAVEGYPGELTPDDLTGVVIHSDLEPTGHFQSSNEWLNRLQHNIVWGQKGNFLEIPTDCPQRNERLGWTGDIQVFAPTANVMMNTASFLTKWLGDLGADQLESGSIPHVIPNVLGEQSSGSSGWADAGVIVPWAMYQAYGDKRILERQYGSMKAWVDHMRDRAARNEDTYLWNGDFTFGDWLSFNTTRSDYPGAFTDKDLISTAFFAHSTRLLSEIALILERKEDHRVYAELFERIRQAFQREFVTPAGRLMSDTQTAYLLALRFDLLPDEYRQAAAAHLVRNIRSHGHLTTGFLGTPHLNPVLSELGQRDLAYTLLLRKNYPSWLYPVTRDATTIWERWDGIRPDGTFQHAGMNSFNHYAYGAIGEWLFKNVAGIRAEEPGYRRIRIEPEPGGGLDHARGLLLSPHGRIESSWQIGPEVFTLEVRIPSNTTAVVTLPRASPGAVTESGRKLDEVEGVADWRQAGDHLVVELGSGHYTFSYPWEKAAGEGSEPTGEPLRGSDRLARILADPGGRAILGRHLPELIHSPWLSQVMGFPLAAAATALPAHLQIPDTTLKAIHGEFRE